jgi:serpin B
MAACDDPVGPKIPDPITSLPRALTAAEEMVIAQANSFGFRLLQEVDARRSPGEANVILSPLSASMALGMALEGAEGETFDELRDALGFQGLSREEINDSYEGLLDLLPELDPDVELGIANSAWIRQGFPFLSSFFDAISTHFDAVAQELAFDNPGTKDVINQWVEEKTEGRIKEIVEQIGPLDVLFLINTVYFNGNWTTQFKKAETRPAPFRLEGGSVVDVDMMNGDIPHTGFTWLEGGRVVAELPYGGQAFGLVVVLPGDGETVDDLLTTLDSGTWDSWMDALHTQEVMVRMPKFELEWDGWLTEPVEALGVVHAFDPILSDFSRLTPREDVYISRIRQKTYMRVDEKGTEAAAATSVGFGATSAPAGLHVDRPYLLAIRERLSGTVLFLGAIRDPRGS